MFFDVYDVLAYIKQDIKYSRYISERVHDITLICASQRKSSRNCAGKYYDKEAMSKIFRM